MDRGTLNFETGYMEHEFITATLSRYLEDEALKEPVFALVWASQYMPPEVKELQPVCRMHDAPVAVVELSDVKHVVLHEAAPWFELGNDTVFVDV